MAITDPRTPGGAAGRSFEYAFYSANSLTWAIGDIVAWDSGANFTVKKAVNDQIALGRVVAVSGPATATSATSTILTIEVFNYTKAIVIDNDATISLGTSPAGVGIHSNGTANYIETDTAAYTNGLVIGSVANAGNGYDITVLF
jgi:hypothetical protein